MQGFPDPVESARLAGLRYVSDSDPGITRRKVGRGFRYTLPSGTVVHGEADLRRIRSLAIPPAWTGVWICVSPLGHIQASGRDARGRKQYRYHQKWREVRDETKYHRMLAFAEVLPRIRQRTEEDMSLPGLPRDKVLATVVRLLEATLIRVGNDEYARENDSFGLTTMRDRHVKVEGAKVYFHFKGKSGKDHRVAVEDRRLARIVKRCHDLPGQELFQYVDENGERQRIHSEDVNEYLHRIAGDEFTAKDFRTWAGTLLAARALQEFEAFDSKAHAKQNVVKAIESVAKRLGNTRAICKKCYVHPGIIDSYLDGSLIEMLKQRAQDELREHLEGLSPEEAAVLVLLRDRLAKEKRSLEEQLRESLEKAPARRPRRPSGYPSRPPAARRAEAAPLAR